MSAAGRALFDVQNELERLRQAHDRLAGELAERDEALAIAQEKLTAQSDIFQRQQIELSAVNERLRDQAERLAKSERTFRSLSDSLPDVIARVDAGGRLIYLNAAAERQTGRTIDQLLGCELCALGFPDALASELRTQLAETLESGRMAEHLLRIPSASGPSRTVEMRYIPELNWLGRVETVLIQIRDVTERQRANVQLEIQQQVLALIVKGAELSEVLDALARLIEAQSGMTASVLLLDSDGRLRHGAAPSLPRAYAESIDGVAIGQGVGSCGTAAFTGETVIVEDLATHPYWAAFSRLALDHGLRACWSHPILAANGRVLGTFALYYTTPRAPLPTELALVSLAASLAGIAIERRQAECELANHLDAVEALNQRLLETDRHKDEFLSVLSHELRTPLNFITGYASTLGDQVQGPLNAGQIEAIHKILQGAERLLGLVDDLLDMSRIQAGKFYVVCQPTALPAVVKSVRESFADAAARGGIALVADLPKNLPPVEADDQRLTQVLINLIGNALKFTPEGGRITIRARVEGAMVRCEVADTGPGVPRAAQQRLFKPFSQVDMTSTRSNGGVGLGLSIVKALVEAQGGAVGLESEAGQGAIFWFTLRVSDASG